MGFFIHHYLGTYSYKVKMLGGSLYESQKTERKGQGFVSPSIGSILMLSAICLGRRTKLMVNWFYQVVLGDMCEVSICKR